MTIKATITAGSDTATLLASDGKLAVEGAEPVVAFLHDFMRPGQVGLYNPRRGGPYAGVDPGDEVAVLDALRLLQRDGLRVEIETADVPELRGPGLAYPGPDTRDEAAMRQLAMESPAPALGADPGDEEALAAGEGGPPGR